jgi:sugar (pentulose or hexulose) kinase
MSDLLCVFDVGTTGARTTIFDINGKEIVRSYEEYPIKEHPVGVSEQDPIIWWNAIKNTCNEVVKKINIRDIIGICAGILRGSCTLIDKEGNPLYSAISMMDERGLTLKEKDGLRLSIPKILWFKRERPNIFERAYKVIFPDTFIYQKLCSNPIFVTEPTNGIYGIMNMKSLDWDKDLANKFDLSFDLWPEICTPGTIVGELSKNAARELGIRSKIPIVLGGGDQQCSALGMGILNQGQAKITMGTYTFVDYVSGDKPVIPTVTDVPIFPIPHVIRGKWLLEGSMPGTGTALKWFKDNFSQLQKEEAEKTNQNIYEILSKEAEEVNPGSNGLLFIPLQMFRKGTIHGLSWNHTRAHMIRSIMEASALSAQLYLGMIEAIGGIKTQELRADGGGMNSDFWAQILADVTSKKVIVPEIVDCSALGAAILGFCGLKQYNRIEDAVDKMVRFNKEFDPIKAHGKVYKKLNRIFFSTILDIYEKKRITKDL